MVDDPYPIYGELRQRRPLYHNENRGFWALSRWNDVQATARDWGRFTSSEGADIDVSADFYGPGDFIAFDPPKHTRLRAVFKDVFSPRGVARLEPIDSRPGRSAARPLHPQGGGEFVAGVASRLPLGVILGVLGFPASRGPRSWPS